MIYFALVPFYFFCFVVALSVIVFVHEFGHYYVARLFGVKIDAFSIGFGKEIRGWNDKNGTRWKLCWLPFGGYVKFAGDANAASFPDKTNSNLSPDHFHAKSVWKRALVVAAGPAANFVLAIVIYTAVFLHQGIRIDAPIVGEVERGSAAEKAGIKPLDVIKKINGREIVTFMDVRKMIFDRGEEEVFLVIERDGATIEMTAVPKIIVREDEMGGKTRIGILGIKSTEAVDNRTNKPHTIFSAVSAATEQTAFVVRTTLRYLGKILTGREKPDQLRSAIGIGEMAGVTALNGFWPSLELIAALSISIGLINLFPVPMLDGGHLVFYAFEALRGRPLGQVAQEWGFRIGISVVLMFMGVAFWNDIARTYLRIVSG
jgi:regulator of sigma E protease